MRNQALHPGQPSQQSHQRGLHLHDDAQPKGRSQVGVAAELDCIAKSLLGMDQQGLALGGLAAPFRRGEFAALSGHLGCLPAPLEFLPALRQFSHQQQRGPQAGMRFGIIRGEGRWPSGKGPIASAGRPLLMCHDP